MLQDSGKRLTIIDLARLAGVSKSTVSLVLNGSPMVKQETREHVQSVIDTVGYVYNKNAALLRAPDNDVIGMVIHDLGNPFFSELSLGIEAQAASRGIGVFMANVGENPERQRQVVRSMRERGAVGLLVSAARGTDGAMLRELAGTGSPVVQVMRRVNDPTLAAVYPNNVGGAKEAVEHLISLGHQHIAFIGGTSLTIVQEERVKGYNAALDQAGLSRDASLIIDCAIRPDDAAQATETLLRDHPNVTAILAFNDTVAIGAMKTLQANGISVGRSFGLIGFDDISFSRWTNPALTTVSVDTHALGRQATDLLLDILDGGTPRQIVGEAKLVIRESCGGRAKAEGSLS